jgi:hypothetical protein
MVPDFLCHTDVRQGRWFTPRVRKQLPAEPCKGSRVPDLARHRLAWCGATQVYGVLSSAALLPRLRRERILNFLSRGQLLGWAAELRQNQRF